MKNRIINFVLVIGSAIAITSCKSGSGANTATTKADNSKEAHKKHWNYEGETGPEHWCEIDKNDCGGQAQSPIDIFGAKKDGSLKPIDFHYDSQTKVHDVVNNGHTIQFNFEPGDYIMISGEKFELKQFHFHEPAEHTINGVRYPLVAHLVHVNKDGKIAVVEVMGKEDDENNDVYEFLEKYLPVKESQSKEINAHLDFSKILPDNKAYYTYTGSLTTPPCTEGVQWFVMKEAIDVSPKMIKDLKDLMPKNNFRSVQPLNGRIIKESM
nr:carbonic anhydrase family protein [uncultured Flavobacterium sp.]